MLEYMEIIIRELKADDFFLLARDKFSYTSMTRNKIINI